MKVEGSVSNVHRLWSGNDVVYRPIEPSTNICAAIYSNFFIGEHKKDNKLCLNMAIWDLKYIGKKKGFLLNKSWIKNRVTDISDASDMVNEKKNC